MPKHETQPELADIFEMIRRYTAVNKNHVCFIGSFIAFDEEKIKNNEADIIKPDADRVFGFGSKHSLRLMLNELRDFIEDEDDDGFVNF